MPTAGVSRQRNTAVGLNVSPASLLGTDVSSQFGSNPAEVHPKGGHLSFSKDNKLSLHSLFVSDQCSAVANVFPGESPIRGLRPPWGLIFRSVFWRAGCQSTNMCTEIISSSLACHSETLFSTVASELISFLPLSNAAFRPEQTSSVLIFRPELVFMLLSKETWAVCD